MALLLPDPSSPPVPAYIFRGHVAAIHALHFFASNAFLASADSDGWIVVWSLASRRAVAVWKGHEGGILALRSWGSKRLISHGRDHRLRVWRLQESDLALLDVKLPVDGADAKTASQPWLLHSMDMNALNFCGFATCVFSDDKGTSVGSVVKSDDAEGTDSNGSRPEATPRPILVAAPNALDSGAIDFFHLPTERRLSKLPADRVTKTGMVMAISLFYNSSQQLIVASGYEDGHTMVHVRQEASGHSERWEWQKVLTSKPHSQPVLSLDVYPDRDFYVTSSADAIMAKFAVPTASLSGSADTKPIKLANTKHAGQQGLSIRSDGKIFATAGWDARIRIYSAKTLKELAVLKWHKDGCYAVTFAEVNPVLHVESAGNDSSALIGMGYGVKSSLELIKQERQTKAQSTHWLTAGGKDGKISLWDVY